MASKLEAHGQSIDKTGVVPFALTTQVVAEPTWTPDLFGRRQRGALALLSRIWDVSP